MRSKRNFAAREANARNGDCHCEISEPSQTREIQAEAKATEVARSKTKSAIQKKPRASSCQASVQRMAAAAKAKRAAREAEAAATSAAAADDEVEFAGERTREQRDAELRARAVEVDA